MDKKIQKALAVLARMEYWETSCCPVCGVSWKDQYGYNDVKHEDDCSVKFARETLESEGIYV